MPDTDGPLRLCVVGATGRMGGTIIKDAPADRFRITGAVAAEGEPGVGKTLKDLEIADLDLIVHPPGSLRELLSSADVCVSFTSAAAEIANLPAVVAAGRPLILGTTGFTESQQRWVLDSLEGKIPCVMASNFSIGANMLFAMTSALKSLPPDFDVSVLEMHHSGKADAPSGTAKTIAEMVSKARGYTTTVYGRSGMSKRAKGELEVASFRGGGMPGEHAIYAFGPHEMLKFEHLAFSRSAFAQGALLAAGWVVQHKEPKVYSMLDVLGFRL
ncbi:MAG: 4-hydroxy-tetrahydrodipicolinate reductase [Thaumarchaeota archaeon]|nr:4-hydroxy-tetrahydrodipicolinate reductase [Nitrososphaerota archaeon]